MRRLLLAAAGGGGAFTAPPSPFGTWERYVGNPILGPGEAGKWDADFRYFLHIVKNTDGSAYVDGDGNYWATYAGTDNFAPLTSLSDDEVGLCYSSDLLTWTSATPDSPYIALTPSTPYSADVACTAAIYNPADDTFYLFCEMNDTASPDNVKLGLFTVEGTITDAPSYQGVVLDNGSGAGNKDNQDIYTFVPVRQLDGTWIAYYGGHSDSGEYGCLYATAATLAGPWTKQSPLTSYLFGGTPLVPTVAWLDGTGKTWLVCDDYLTLTEAHLLSAPDGLTFTYEGVAFERGASGQWDDTAVYDFDQVAALGQVFTYYTAQSGGDPFVQVGVALSDKRPALLP